MRRLLLVIVALAGLLAGGSALAQSAAPPEPSPADLSALAALLRDPAIQAWLQAEADRAPAATQAAAAEPQGAQHAMVGQLDATRAFLRTLVAAVPQLPGELAGAWRTLAGDMMQERAALDVAILLAVFAALGFGLEWLFWWATTGFRQRMIAAGLDTVRARLQAVGRRFAYGIGMVLAFAFGSIGGFLLFEWPRVLKEVVLAYLLVFLIIRLVLVLGRILLAPGAERFRMVPMATASARFWFLWSTVLIGWLAFVRITLDVLMMLGTSEPARALVALACGVVLVALALFVVWRHPERESGLRVRRSQRVGTWLLSIYVVVVWLLLFTGSAAPFYVGVILLLLPIAIRGSRLAVAHVLRHAADEVADPVPSLTAVTLDRGLRAALLIGGAYLVAWILGVDFGMLGERDTLAVRLVRGAINVVVIALLADLAWHLAAAWIDRKLVQASGPAGADTEAVRRQARLRTLLPILRNVLLIVLVTMAVLMALSSMGVEIGPLIAGAGVVGVAIGFGAQTLVKDVISGMFYLLDDAFRIGEYIISGSYKGTVESFSLRSIKLRHHRGYLYTVPFGELGAVQNMSRDWVIDKLSVGVTYDTDLDKVKKIIKQISSEIMADPELAPNIIEPLKMQGVEQFGDFAIQIRMKMTTKPGEQFVIRRRAYGMIKKAFAANDIHFALPTVTVAGGEATPAVAQQAIELTRPPTAAE